MVTPEPRPRPAPIIVGYLRWLGWLSDWLAGQGLAAGALNEARAGRFAASMREAGHPKITPGRRATMLCYLREAGAIPAEPASPSSATQRQQLLAAYRTYMTARDLAPGTITTRLRVAAMFLDGLGGDAAGDAVTHLTPRQVLAVLGCWGRLARRRSSELRAFMRYLHAAGHTGEDLAVVIFTARPGAAPRRAARLEAAEVTAVLDGIERSGERGCRDYAVLLLVARLGLRACEVCRLTLADIRWRVGTLVIHRKGGRAEEFPLLADIGQALAGYLQARSLVAGTRAVFVTTVAPRRAMTRQGIGQIVRTACARAGRPAGPHQFRHLLGGTLLQAGVPLAGIAQVLGHRALAVTSGYAAPGRSQIADLIRPWPLAEPQ
ncbi:MAG TPA: tyrosine-type recombinase/integrase [Streptosporangiaceae bacterium]|nr:tyrosine-type recombinase/integrase [Streptosporangiaceae bacterium]